MNKLLTFFRRLFCRHDDKGNKEEWFYYNDNDLYKKLTFLYCSKCNKEVKYKSELLTVKVRMIPATPKKVFLDE